MPDRESTDHSRFAIFGVPVRLHFTFLLMLALLGAAGVISDGSALLEILVLITLFVCVLLHELGHALAARAYGIRTTEIILYPIGGIAKLQSQPAPKADLIIAIAGPLVNVAIALLILAGTRLAADKAFADVLTEIARDNFYLAGFNMVPAFPMDGGRVLRALLVLWKGEERGGNISTMTARILALLMGLTGLFFQNYFIVLIAFIVFSVATQEGAANAGRALTRGIPVQDAMVTEFQTLPHGCTMRDASERLLATSQQDFPVVHGDSVIGLLDRTSFLRGIAEFGADSYVSTAMDRNFIRLEPAADLSTVLPSMSPSTPCALVMEGDRLLGLLTRENISEFLMMRRFGITPQARTTGPA